MIQRLILFFLFLSPLIGLTNPEPEPPATEWLWQPASSLSISGKGWPNESTPFTRLPERARESVRPPVWDLSLDSAGLHIDFTTDAPTLKIRWSPLKERLAMNHMPATGVSGLDLYLRHENSWRFAGVARPTDSTQNETTFFQNLPAQNREFRLNFPLYNGLKSLEIGIPAGYSLQSSPAPAAKPILFYGTSIVQGGCASRPGMAHTSIIGRQTSLPVINLGFSGNGRAEPEVAELIAELSPALFILDPLPNITAENVGPNMKTFIEILRKKHPEAPILLIEHLNLPTGILLPDQTSKIHRANSSLKAVFNHFKSNGDQNIFLHRAENLLGTDGEDTVDGIHPTDLGFIRMADGLLPAIRNILSIRENRP